MKRSDHDKLLREMLTGVEVSDFRKASLEGGLASLRRRRRYRRVAQAGVVMALTLLVALGIVHERTQNKLARQMASVKPISNSPVASPAPSSENSKVNIISDEELFALFPGRSMALIGKPGEQQLVFLDGGTAQAKAR